MITGTSGTVGGFLNVRELTEPEMAEMNRQIAEAYRNLKGPMSERTVYSHEAEEAPLRVEWVRLAKGEVCVHELTLADSLSITERCQRHPNDPRGAGVDHSQMVLLQIMMSTYYDEQPEGRRVFADQDFLKLHRLKNWEMDALLQAINRVNGKDATELEALRDFIAAREGLKASPCARGA